MTFPKYDCGATNDRFERELEHRVADMDGPIAARELRKYLESREQERRDLQDTIREQDLYIMGLEDDRDAMLARQVDADDDYDPEDH